MSTKTIQQAVEDKINEMTGRFSIFDITKALREDTNAQKYWVDYGYGGTWWVGHDKVKKIVETLSYISVVDNGNYNGQPYRIFEKTTFQSSPVSSSTTISNPTTNSINFPSLDNYIMRNQPTTIRRIHSRLKIRGLTTPMLFAILSAKYRVNPSATLGKSEVTL